MISIAIVGPESTGKTTLAESLATHYETIWVPEYAREYLSEQGGQYDQSDLLKIAKRQIDLEKKYRKRAKDLIFLDTDLFVLKVWSQVKYGHCDPWVAQQLQMHRADAYLLTYFDIPYEEDPLREHPEMRPELFDMYDAELRAHGVNYKVVRGNANERLEQAVRYINTII